MTRATGLVACVGVLCGVLACARGDLLPGSSDRKTAVKATWPAWRGANRDAKSPDKGLLKAWPARGPKKLWTVTGLGHGFSSVTVVGNMLYTTGHVRRKLILFGLDGTGEEQWRVDVGPGFYKSAPGARSTPTVDEGRVYIVSGMGQVGCYDARRGKTIWTRKLSEFGGRVPQWGFAESVLIAGDLAIVTPGGKSCIVALNKKTGETVWQSPPFGGAQYSSPIHIKHRGREMIVNGTHSGILGVDAKSGKLLWKNRFSAGNTANCPTPAFADGKIFWATGYGKGGICLSLGGYGGAEATQVWKSSSMDCKHGGYVIVDGHIYGNDGVGWTCLDLNTGQKKWHAESVGRGSICYADGMLYLLGERGGKMALVEATPEAYKQSGQGRVRGGGPAWAHPIVIGGRLYVRYDERLYCFDVRNKAAAAPRR